MLVIRRPISERYSYAAYPNNAVMDATAAGSLYEELAVDAGLAAAPRTVPSTSVATFRQRFVSGFLS